jgi:hypothetical protein
MRHPMSRPWCRDRCRYTPTRERAGPEQFLKGHRGNLQADTYVAYASFFTNPELGMVEVAFWAHTT